VTTWSKRLLGVAVFIAAVALASEVRALVTPYRDPPAAISGWRLAAAAECGNSAPPDARFWRGVAGARRVCRAEYAGDPPMRLTLFDMPGYPVGPGAFDAFQKWTPDQPARIGFFAGRFFGVAESPRNDRQALNRFADAVARSLTGAAPGGKW